MSKSKRRVISLVVLAIAILISARLFSRHAAVNYGKYLGQAYSAVGISGFTSPGGLDDFFKEPDLIACERRTQKLSFLGGDYNQRIMELKSGITYLSDQARLPENERFAKPPNFQYIHINTTDRSYNGIDKAIIDLISEYLDQF